MYTYYTYAAGMDSVVPPTNDIAVEGKTSHSAFLIPTAYALFVDFNNSLC